MEKKLDLSDQSLIREKFSKLNLQLSEYSFANLYLFRDLHRYRLMTIAEEIFIRGITRDGSEFLMLTSHPKDILPKTLLEASGRADFFYPIHDSWLPFLEERLLQKSFLEEDSDYLFLAEKLATYPGRQLSKKRNLVKQLFRDHEVIGQGLSPPLLAEAKSVLDNWKEDRAQDLDHTDYEACKESLLLFSELQLHGRIIYVDNEPSGFVIGEWLTADCYVAHFAKARHDTKGLYQYLFQDLGQQFAERKGWINIEQDLGVPELHQSKQSYLPDRLLKKWRVKIE